VPIKPYVMLALTLPQAQCHLYSTTFNPEGLRLGNKVLRKRLQGPSLVSYYIPRIVDFKDMEKEFEPYDLIVNNEQEDDRLDHISGLVPLIP